MKDNFLVLLVLRVSFTLFNLQGTRSGLSTSSAIYFSTLFFACQVLFSEVFQLLAEALSFKLRSPFRGTRSFYHTLSSLSRTFFKVFSRFLHRSTPISSSFLNSSASHANSFILTRASRFVKHFFQKSFGSPSRFPSVSSAISSAFVPSREVLGYYISLFSLCQHSFSNFFDFLERSS